MTSLILGAGQFFVYFALPILYLLAAWNCWRILAQRLSSGATIAWIIVQVAFPFIGVPLYFLLGQQRINGYLKRHRHAAAISANEEQLLTRLPPSLEPDQVPIRLRDSYSIFRRIFSGFGAVFHPQLAAITLLIDGTTTFAAIFDSIKTAERYILVQYYILRSDRLGLELKKLLIDKAKSGIHVFLLYDDMGSIWLSRQYILDLKEAGVHVERFLPLENFKRFFQLNFRNHRKLVVVDGKVAFTGGLNIGEEYATAKSRGARKKSSRYWRDTHLRLEGPSVTQIEDVFLEDWFFASGEQLDPKVVSSRRPPPTQPVPISSHPIAQVIPTGPTDQIVVSLMLLLQLINSAKHRLWIATPYFVPDNTILRCLELAILRGVDVKIMIPQKADNQFVHWVSLSFAEQLQNAGAEVLLFYAGFMHQKAIIVDDITAAIGTMNIDNRALYLNFETTILIHSYEFTANLIQVFKNDFLSCAYYRRPSGFIHKNLYKLRANAARLAAPLL